MLESRFHRSKILSFRIWLQFKGKSPGFDFSRSRGHKPIDLDFSPEAGLPTLHETNDSNPLPLVEFVAPRPLALFSLSDSHPGWRASPRPTARSLAA